DQAAERARLVVQIVHSFGTEGEAGTQQGAFQALAVAHANAPAIERGAAAATGGEFFLANRVEHDGVLQSAAVFAGNADGKVWHAAEEVGGAVQRVDDPLVVGAVAAAGDAAAFLAQEAVRSEEHTSELQSREKLVC